MWSGEGEKWNAGRVDKRKRIEGIIEVELSVTIVNRETTSTKETGG